MEASKINFDWKAGLNKANRKSRGRLFEGIGAMGLIGSVFFADRLLKDSIERQPEEIFPHDMPGSLGKHARFEKLHNKGFALGAFQKEPFFVKAIPTAALCLAVSELSALLAMKKQRLTRLGLCLVIGGGLSNLYDRLRLGYVVDYINLKKKPFQKIVLNIGDLAIFLGAALTAAGSAAGSLSRSLKGKR